MALVEQIRRKGKNIDGSEIDLKNEVENRMVNMSKRLRERKTAEWETYKTPRKERKMMLAH